MWNLFKRRTSLENQNGSPEELQQIHWRFSMALSTDIGCQRETNEDAGLLVPPSSDSSSYQKDLLAVVADGMGGYQSGEVASQLAIQVVSRAYYDGIGAPAQRLSNALLAANRAIYERSSESEQLRGMGTTCTALALCKNNAYLAHVGDSRLYLIRNNAIYQMSEDHSFVMDLVRKGIITAEEAREHPDRNVLQRALGRQPTVEISGWPEGTPLQAGDCYLLCSDGLYGIVGDETIRAIVLAHDPADACAALIDLARRAGAPDNITIGIVKIEKAEEEPALLPATRELKIAERETGSAGWRLTND